LGKYCSCCSHLEGAGDSITKASILHPDCQNLVIINDKGVIIAKSTLYINRKQGYGVFNTIEINDDVRVVEKKEYIYEKFMQAVNDFAERYNQINSDIPLKYITVGVRMNKLGDLIRKNKEKIRCFRGVDFREYGSYEGDWHEGQYTVWKAKKR